MAVTAVVRGWDEAEGWGVLESPVTPGGFWTHWWSIAVDGFRSLVPGQDVELEWEPADQDGYSYRALWAWPAGVDPVEHDSADHESAYSSELMVRFDDDPS